MANPRVSPEVSPGTLPHDVYSRKLGVWRDSARRVLLVPIQWETTLIAKAQERLCSPFLDSYFSFSALLGTPTFFVSAISLFFLFGQPDAGRGLLHVLGAGGYLSSLIKDLLCVPRPYSPPVVRLTTGNHHLEYGFPSTHATNSVSATLYLYALMREAQISPELSYIATTILAVYVGSVVLGRIYCGMHSVLDCVAGAILGTFAWTMQLRYGQWLEDWMTTSGLTVPAITLSLWAFLMFNHPSTVEICLCFDDTIACLSAIAGTTIARWSSATLMFPDRFSPSRSWRSEVYWTTYLVIPAKILITLSCLALWRVMIKTLLPNLLESIHPSPVLARRPEPDSYAKKPNGTHPTSDPSVMDSFPPLLRRGFSSSCVPQPSEQNGSGAVVPGTPMNASPFTTNQVIVKTIVYFGIGWLGSEILPAFFERLGWS